MIAYIWTQDILTNLNWLGVGRLLLDEALKSLYGSAVEGIARAENTVYLLGEHIGPLTKDGPPL